ncbi:TetR/AcrR family transcriptional regulator [Nocardia bhagyanarayanae]|uniref:TetR family transcriptional regulator n=1 Tax=Nocardia bhagyanarayanae TaxID=1215925 RepID=A0A543FGC1_9NOCA|nr:TetR/AcrR family transcriptional regulator [Nocardia bhagyanarayanae]TQM32913.1 TetR family transcriptional regulator [Nocardia bhagyanarayanae]
MPPSARDRLVAATIKLTREHGGQITTAQIAREAGCSEGNIFKQFGSKSALLTTALCEELPRIAIADSVAAVGSGDLDKNLRDLLSALIEFQGSALPLMAVLLSDPALRAEYQQVSGKQGTGPQLAVDRIADYLRAEQELGRLRGDLDADAAAVLLLGAAQNLALTELATGSPRQTDRLLPDVATLLTTSLTR